MQYKHDAGRENTISFQELELKCRWVVQGRWWRPCCKSVACTVLLRCWLDLASDTGVEIRHARYRSQRLHWLAVGLYPEEPGSRGGSSW